MVTDGNISNSISSRGSRSRFLTRKKIQEVLLNDWWLVKAEGNKGIAVGGIAYVAGLGTKVFTSDAIVKRHDINVLETADGVRVFVTGIINMSFTHQNGFSAQVCNQFLFGFPHDWEEYATCAGEGCFNNRSSTKDGVNISVLHTPHNVLPFPCDDLHVTRIQDLLMSNFGELDNSMTLKGSQHDIVGISRGTTFNQSESINCNGDDNENQIMYKKAEECYTHSPDVNILDLSSINIEERKRRNSLPSDEKLNLSTPSSVQSVGGMKKSKMFPTEKVEEHQSSPCTKNAYRRMNQTSKVSYRPRHAEVNPSTPSRVQCNGNMKCKTSEQMEEHHSTNRTGIRAYRRNKTSEAASSCPSRMVTRSVSKMTGTTFLCL